MQQAAASASRGVISAVCKRRGVKSAGDNVAAASVNGGGGGGVAAMTAIRCAYHLRCLACISRYASPYAAFAPRHLAHAPSQPLRLRHTRSARLRICARLFCWLICTASVFTAALKALHRFLSRHRRCCAAGEGESRRGVGAGVIETARNSETENWQKWYITYAEKHGK